MREIAPFGLRLTPKLKDRLEEEARAGGRSLQKEIIMRLETSLHVSTTGHLARQENAPYRVGDSETENQMLKLFRQWPPEKQLSFLVLFK